jgi:hypothetical protein
MTLLMVALLLESPHGSFLSRPYYVKDIISFSSQTQNKDVFEFDIYGHPSRENVQSHGFVQNNSQSSSSKFAKLPDNGSTYMSRKLVLDDVNKDKITLNFYQKPYTTREKSVQI